MGAGWVALMPGKTVLRIEAVEAAHDRVPRHFGDDRRGGDRDAEGIPPDNRQAGAPRLGSHRAVDKDVLGFDGEVGEGEFHRPFRRLIDIDVVDRLLVDDADADDRFFDDLAVGLFALTGAEAFRVVDALGKTEAFQDNGARDDRTGERAATRLIDAGDQGIPLLSQPPLVTVEARSAQVCFPVRSPASRRLPHARSFLQRASPFRSFS